MSARQRFRMLITAAFMILISVILIAFPGIGVPVAGLILGAILLFMGLRYLFYYMTMAKNMVGGKLMLYLGIILLDIGAFSLTILNSYQTFILLFLQAVFGITGAISILRAVEAKKSGSPAWKANFLNGVINIGIMIAAFICANFSVPERMIVYVFCAGMLYAAAMRIYPVFRKTAVVYDDSY
ncbi:MAG: hypothetical protein IJH51_01745 [Christensenellaceae bacterium]|nr:hypothetical protein [Christensenellaceae bacterium]